MLQAKELLSLENKAEQFLKRYWENKDMPVCLYGAGEGLPYYIKFLKKYNVAVACIIDGKLNEGGGAKSLYGIRMRTLGEAQSRYREAIVVISSPAHRKEIAKRLEDTAPEFWVCTFDPLLDIIQDVSAVERKVFYREHIKELLQLERDLADDLSRKTLECVLKGALTNDSDCYESMSYSSMYFPDIIMNQMDEDREIFVDIGAFTGDSAEEFISIVDNRYQKIYAFEPDHGNALVARRNLQDDRIVIYEQGVGSENTILYFNRENEETDSGAHVVEKESMSTTRIEVVRLDDVIQEDVTYIKMDIEGMELNALRGAGRLIRSCRPKLAVSIYHKMEDILYIPQYIRDLNLDYQIYLRHYWKHNGSDTILFAVPDYRKNVGNEKEKICWK